MLKIVFFENEQILADIYIKHFVAEAIVIVHKTNPPKNLVEFISTENPDVILTDIIMPEMDGFKAIKILKSDGRTKDIPVVVLTNLSQEEDKKKAFSLGVERFLIRSEVTPVEVVNTIKSMFK